MAAASQPFEPGHHLAELEGLFREHYPLVFRAAYRVTGNVNDAEDVLQTVFVRLIEGRGGRQRLENAASYLYRAAVNAALDVVRARRTSQHVALECVAPRLAEAGGSLPDVQQQEREFRLWLDEALLRLPERSAEMFVLRYFEGLGNGEIAQLLHTTPGTVAVTLHRTRERLQEELQVYLGGSQ